jgi:hypothetical protein
MPVDVRVGRSTFQAIPDPDARALPTRYGLAEERAWLRSSLPAEFEAASTAVAGALAQHPGLRVGTDPVSDAAAVRMYLGELGDGLDAVLRNGEPGPQVPFARCVAGGLARLPAYRGAAVLTAGLTAADRGELRQRGILTDWGFTQALTEPAVGLPGHTDVLIWSLTARRTRLLEPAGDHRVDARAVFLPGTSFKVLVVADPAPGGRGLVLLREIEDDELSRGHVPFDDFTVTALHRAIDQWRVPGPAATVGPAARDRFTTVPGTRFR